MNDQRFMALALELAKAATGQTSPNPVVGAVVVKEQAIVGMGAHLKAGEPHAEVHALQMAGSKSEGAAIYVTLEPCSHFGKTPPCVDAIINAGIARVVIATLDPNPLVAGMGAARLRDAGLQVEIGVMEAEARKLNEIFFYYIKSGQPFVTVKTASTLDGKIATETGDSRWITGEKARLHVHQLRRTHDAILVGVNTIIQDDPELTSRSNGVATGSQPLRIILDSSLRIPLTTRVITDGKAQTQIYTTSHAPVAKKEALEKLGIKVVTAESGDHWPINKLLTSLGQQGITSLLVEGGAAVNGAFLEAQAINKIVSYVSLKLIGGAAAPTSYGGDGILKMADAVRLQDTEIERVSEEDICVTGYPLWPAQMTQAEGE